MTNQKETSNLISMDKRYKTRDGRDVRVLCTDNLVDVWTVIATIDGTPTSYTRSGKYYNCEDECELDLIEQPQEHSVWIEVFKSNGCALSCSYESEKAMVESIRDSKNSSTAYEYTLLATKKVVLTEGESCL